MLRARLQRLERGTRHPEGRLDLETVAAAAERMLARMTPAERADHDARLTNELEAWRQQRGLK